MAIGKFNSEQLQELKKLSKNMNTPIMMTQQFRNTGKSQIFFDIHAKKSKEQELQEQLDEAIEAYEEEVEYSQSLEDENCRLQSIIDEMSKCE